MIRYVPSNLYGQRPSWIHLDHKNLDNDLLSTYASPRNLRTNKHFTLKQNRLTRSDLDEFVACYNPENRHERKPTWSHESLDGRWRAYTYKEIIARDKASLDIFWLRDESLEDSTNLPDPNVIAAEIIEDLQAALEELQAISDDLNRTPSLRENNSQ